MERNFLLINAGLETLASIDEQVGLPTGGVI